MRRPCTSDNVECGIGMFFRSACCVLTSALLLGCSHPRDTIMPLSKTPIRLDDAVPLVKHRKPGDALNIGFKLGRPLVEHTLYFGELTNEDDLAIPIVAVSKNGQLHGILFENEWSGNGWQRVVAGPHRGEIWGALDHLEEDLGWDLVLAHSTDSGKTWRLGALRKVCYVAELYDIVMAENGNGRVTLRLASDYTDKLKAGLYHYVTTDGGKSWSAPQYEADSTVPADEVPEDQQPKEVQVASGPANK